MATPAPSFLDRELSLAPLGDRRFVWLTWLCALSPIIGMVMFLITAAWVRFEFGRWPANAVDRLSGPLDISATAMIILVGFGAFLALPILFLLQRVPRFRRSARLLGLQTAVVVLGNLSTAAIISWALPVSWVTWFID